jgi:transposase
MKPKITKKQKRKSSFAPINLFSAGIDVGDREMVVCVDPSLSESNLRTFGTFTCDLKEIVLWLQECKVTHVALESTGVYWLQLYLFLEKSGFEVSLANAKHIKNVSGRKDDKNDAMWIQKLHSCGLISGSFQPSDLVRGLRDLMRNRRSLIQDQSKCTNRIIKALEQMNIKVQTVLSDIDGKSGKAMLDAIVKGERNASVLASLADPRVKTPFEILVKSLEGNWNEIQLVLLGQQYKMYNYLAVQIKDLDQYIEDQLIKIQASENQGEIKKEDIEITRKRSTRKNAISFNATASLVNILGTDLTAIPGVSELTAMEIISEIGTDITKWPSSKHFNAWLGITPNTKISGGKIISNKVIKKNNRAGQALRIAAFSLKTNKSELGNYYRSKQAKGGPPKAILATASKIGTFIYNMIKNKEPYNPILMSKNQEKQNEQKIKKLEKIIEKLKNAA